MARKKPSPAMALLATIWENQGHQMGDSWDRLNQAMGSATNLAIWSGLRFDLRDFQTIADKYRISYWGGEGFYHLACGGRDPRSTPNMSAALSFEKWKGRKPFIVLARPRGKVRLRVAIGTRFDWYEHKPPKLLHLTCTSFAKDGESFTACAYESANRYGKPIRRIKITRAKIVEYHANIRELLKEAREKQAPDGKD